MRRHRDQRQIAVVATKLVYCQKEKRATVFCKVGVPTTAKQHSVGLQQLQQHVQQLVCVGVGCGYAARATAH